MNVVDRISAHDSHGKAVLAAPREDTEQFVNITESYINLFPWISCIFRDVVSHKVANEAGREAACG